jgi:hypothetical protein
LQSELHSNYTNLEKIEEMYTNNKEEEEEGLKLIYIIQESIKTE